MMRGLGEGCLQARNRCSEEMSEASLSSVIFGGRDWRCSGGVARQAAAGRRRCHSKQPAQRSRASRLRSGSAAGLRDAQPRRPPKVPKLGFSRTDGSTVRPLRATGQEPTAAASSHLSTVRASFPASHRPLACPSPHPPSPACPKASHPPSSAAPLAPSHLTFRSALSLACLALSLSLRFLLRTFHSRSVLNSSTNQPVPSFTSQQPTPTECRRARGSRRLRRRKSSLPCLPMRAKRKKSTKTPKFPSTRRTRRKTTKKSRKKPSQPSPSLRSARRRKTPRPTPPTMTRKSPKLSRPTRKKPATARSSLTTRGAPKTMRSLMPPSRGLRTILSPILRSRAPQLLRRRRKRQLRCPRRLS